MPDEYGLSHVASLRRIEAPALPYRPPTLGGRCPGIGLIGCGGIAGQQLAAYAHAGFRVVALCDRTESKARALAERFYPDAFVTTEANALLARPEVEVVDLATHARDRESLIEAALLARKHALSQKPFVLDLALGHRFAELAARQGVQLAVNQNGRWAPHFSYLRQALAAGCIGELQSLSFTLHWDHTWIIGTPFEEMEELLLLDFAIHWFDLAACFFGDREPLRVHASATRGRGQLARPPLLAQVAIEFEDGQATMTFNGNVAHGQEDRTFLAGTRGSLLSAGPSLSAQTVTLFTEEGFAQPALEGTWFREGFQGAMAELLRAIEDGRTPANNARDNLRGLALCFAALESAREGEKRTRRK